MRRAATLDLDAVLADLLGDGDGAPPRAGRAQEGDRVAEALVDAASALLAERGTTGWTMEDVAERAALGRATLYRRFTSREELVTAAIARDARRFFAAIAESVQGVEPLDEKVVSGFLNGLRLAQYLPLSSLLRNDPLAAMSLLRSESLLATATDALTERYERLLGRSLRGAARARAEVAAEALIRLALSFVLIPGRAADMEDERQARDHLAGIIRPLLSGRS